ncbi:MAG TPA: glycosyltransferase [Gemmataceae bacterium]|nr:glycosyltransferase [Gemmataceae bacterium]
MSSGAGKRVLFCSWHCYFDPSSGAAHSLRDLLELLSARGWVCRALSAAHLDYEQPRPLTELLTAHGLTFRVAPGEWRVEFEQRGVGVTIHAPPVVAREDAVTAADAAPLLALYERALDDYRPDLVLTYGGYALGREIIARARRRGLPVVFWLRNFAYPKSDLFREVSGTVVGSRYSREAYRQRLGIDCTVIPSPLDWGKFFCPEGTHGRHVAFVNPQPQKGVFPFARIADELGRRRPDVPLLVVEGRGGASWLGRTGLDLSGRNLRVMPHTPDPREIYRASRVVLMPSLWEESFGRVAAEALANGIPVLGSRRGALTETLAEAGFLFDVPAQYTPESREVPTAEEMAPWVSTVLRLYDDEAFYQEQRRRCRAAAETWRPEVIGDRYETYLLSVMGRRATGLVPAVHTAGTSPAARPAEGGVPGSRRYLTFVNPEPAEGLFLFARLAVELARRRPDVPLLVVEGRGRAEALWDTGLDLRGLVNLYVMAATPDPRDFYRLTRALLVPALGPDPPIRPAVEALGNGIPVLASDRGGLVSTLAGAGFLFDVPPRYTPDARLVPSAAEVGPWVDTVLRLWDDAAFYEDQRRRCLTAARAWQADRPDPVSADGPRPHGAVRLFLTPEAMLRPAPPGACGPAPRVP